MRKTKMEKGITLIALVITIVVLLILAMVTIKSITNDRILEKAQNAAKTYNEATKNEQSVLDSYIGYLSGWQQNGKTVTKVGTDGQPITLEVGQTVTGYTSPAGTTDPGWAVLGAKNGNLLLVSKVNVGSLTLNVGSVTLNGLGESSNGAEKMDQICAKYLNKTLADEARSIEGADIDRVGWVTDTSTMTYELLFSGTFSDEGAYWLRELEVGAASDAGVIVKVVANGGASTSLIASDEAVMSGGEQKHLGVRAVITISNWIAVTQTSEGAHLGN